MYSDNGVSILYELTTTEHVDAFSFKSACRVKDWRQSCFIGWNIPLCHIGSCCPLFSEQIDCICFSAERTLSFTHYHSARRLENAVGTHIQLLLICKLSLTRCQKANKYSLYNYVAVLDWNDVYVITGQVTRCGRLIVMIRGSSGSLGPCFSTLFLRNHSPACLRCFLFQHTSPSALSRAW